MKFGLFYQLPCAPDQSEVLRYRETIEQIQRGEELGFDCAWLAELHFYKPFSIMPSPLIVATAAAQKTSRIRLGIAVNLLPLWHPLRSAEDGATVDLLSDGRLEFGVGRGGIPLHFAGFNASRDESRERFEESLEIITRAWTEESFRFSGKYYQVPETSVVPKPLQRPHPPLRIAANSPDTAIYAGEQRYPIFVASVTNPLPHMFDQVARYRAAWRASTAPPANGGGEGAEPEVSTMFFVRPGETLAEVQRAIEPSLRNYFDSVKSMALPPGVADDGAESYRYMRRVRSDLEDLRFETITERMAVFGSPGECIERIAKLHEELGMKELICWFNPGGRVPHESVLAAMTRFAEEVAPALRGLD